MKKTFIHKKNGAIAIKEATEGYYRIFDSPEAVKINAGSPISPKFIEESSDWKEDKK